MKKNRLFHFAIIIFIMFLNTGCDHYPCFRTEKADVDTQFREKQHSLDSLFSIKSPKILEYSTYSVFEDTALIPASVNILNIKDMYQRARWEFYLFDFDRAFDDSHKNDIISTGKPESFMGYYNDTLVFSFRFVDNQTRKWLKPSKGSPYFTCYFGYNTRQLIGYNFGINRTIVPSLYQSKLEYKERTIKFIDFLRAKQEFIESKWLIEYGEVLIDSLAN